MFKRLGDKSLLIVGIQGGTVFSSKEKGLKPLAEAAKKGLLRGNIVVDRVLGMAAAKILLRHPPLNVFALTASEKAVKYLNSSGIPCRAETRVGSINCSFEEKAATATAEQLLELILEEP